jgi:hypothetical protein
LRRNQPGRIQWTTVPLLDRTSRSGSGEESGGGMATAGIVLGWIGVGFIVVAVVVGIAANA